MNRFLLVTCLAVTACSEANYSMPSLSKAISYSGNLEGGVCPTGKNYLAKDGSHISWHAMKITAAGLNVPLTGTNAIVGGLNIKNDTWAEASSTIDFISSSTNSEDSLRDIRINSLIFGANEGMAFSFKVDSIDGDRLEMAENESRNVTVKGTLKLGGRSTKIVMPALVKQLPDVISITPAEVYKLNLRSLSPVVNGINLVDSVQRLLDLVPGVKMEDDVTIDFNLEFKPTCL